MTSVAVVVMLVFRCFPSFLFLVRSPSAFLGPIGALECGFHYFDVCLFRCQQGNCKETKKQPPQNKQTKTLSLHRCSCSLRLRVRAHSRHL